VTEKLLNPYKYTHTHTHTHIYIYINVLVFTYLCTDACTNWNRVF